mgnify:CR=1 FL=1
MLRQVRGLGTLVPGRHPLDSSHHPGAESNASCCGRASSVERRQYRPRIINPQLEQELEDAELKLKSV